MADLQDRATPSGQSDHFVGFGCLPCKAASRPRDAGPHRETRERSCNARWWRGDDGAVDPIEQAFVIGSRLAAALAGDFLAAGGNRIDDCHKFHVLACGQLLGMKSAQTSRADHGYA